MLLVPHRSSLNQLTSSRSYFRIIRATITLIHLFYRCNSMLPLHPSVRLRSSIILRCGVRKKTTLFLHFLCTSVRIGISYESTCFAFLYLPNPHRAFDNMLFSSPLQHSRYASFLRPPPNRTEIEKQNFPPPRSRVRNSPLTLAIAVIGEAPPQTHFFPLLVVGSHSCTSPHSTHYS